MMTPSEHTEIVYAGLPLDKASKAMILIHGRGATADDILSLTQYLPVKDFALLAPQATNYTWYPNSFLASPALNEPWLTSAIKLLSECVSKITESGIAADQIYFLGFSQGACLTLEYVTRNAKHYGGVIAFTGGLIGDKIYAEKYSGDFNQTPIFIGSSNPDPHVPVDRVHASSGLLKNMNAAVSEKIYPNMGHTVNNDEISEAVKILEA
jgi:phospholipase/carboxylesterase